MKITSARAVFSGPSNNAVEESWVNELLFER